MSDQAVNASSDQQDVNIDPGFIDDTEYMLTTVDNPYNPFDDFQTWLAYDIQKGYHSIELLGRLAGTSDEQTESMRVTTINRAIDTIVEENITGMFRKVSRSSFGSVTS